MNLMPEGMTHGLVIVFKFISRIVVFFHEPIQTSCFKPILYHFKHYIMII